jgi:nucleoid-associated protein YgaU
VKTDPYALRCPVCKRSVTVNDARRCPVCDSDLSSIIGWRVHATGLYNQAVAACRDGKWDRAAAFLEECLRLSPSFAPAEALLDKVQARQRRTENSSWVRRRVAVGATLALLALVGAAALAAGLYVGGSHTPSPKVIVAEVTVLVTPTPGPSTSPSPSPATPAALSSTPGPMCPGLAQRIGARWTTIPDLDPETLQANVDGCTARISGKTATSYLRNLAGAAAHAAGAMQVDTSAVTLTLTYVVQPGDTMASISRALYGDTARADDITGLNPALPADLREMQPGLVLKLPL